MDHHHLIFILSLIHVLLRSKAALSSSPHLTIIDFSGDPTLPPEARQCMPSRGECFYNKGVAMAHKIIASFAVDAK